MFSIHKISDAGAAFNYFRDRDDYYSSDASSAEWWGTGAEQLCLRGDVESQTSRDLLEGKVGDQQVGRSGFREVFGADGRAHKVPNHAAGWDVTFSAPKSFSIAGLVHRDDRLVAAHDRAVRTATAYIEQQAAVTRQRSKDGSYVYRSTAGLVAAMFRHASSRDHDPQLHTHVVVANVTWDETTRRWVSLWSREGLYRIHAQAESIYQNELAAAAREAGYSVEWSVDDHGFPTAEVAEIGAKERSLFSQRKAEIDAALAAKGITREQATQRQREAATLETRSPKEHIEASEQHRLWQDRLEQSGLARNIQSAPVRGNRRHGADAADTAVTAAVASLSERSARFTANDLLTEARVFSQGRANEPELEAAVARAKDQGDLILRKTRVRVPGGDRVLVDGFTTEKGETIEKAMLAAADRIAGGGGNRLGIGEAKVHGNTPEVIDRLIADAEARTGHALTTEHRAAVSGILAGNSNLHLLDGRAGTAKTTAVLAVIAGHAEANGWRARAMAPTASAAATLGDAIKAESSTIAKAISRQPARDARPELWIVDEAGLASAKDTAALLEQANRAGAHVILTGDDRQIGSVGAGRAFQQLQDAHPGSTYRLTDIKRQRSETLKQAVIDSVDGRVTAALSRVQVTERADRDGAIATIADAYMRSTTNGKDTLVVALSRADRAEINGAIQHRREVAGEVSGAQEITTLAAKSWTAEQRKDASRYRAGDIVVAHRDFKHLARGEAATVTRAEDNKITVRTARGEWTFDPKRIAAYSVMNVGQTRVGDGDRIVLKGTTGALINGERQQLRNGTVLTVWGIQANRITATDARNRQVEIDASHGIQADLAYAQTADQAQGRTVDSVIGYMRSGQSNLATQQRAYVLLSRARDDALIVTDNKARLAEALTKNRGNKETALERGVLHTEPVVRDGGRVVASRSSQLVRRQADDTQADHKESGLARLQAMAAAGRTHAVQAPTRDTRHGAQQGPTYDDGRER